VFWVLRQCVCASSWLASRRCAGGGEPLSVARCNKLATLSAEQAVEVVRNHEGGTGPVGWHRSAEGSLGSREWTSQGCRRRGEHASTLCDRSRGQCGLPRRQRDPGPYESMWRPKSGGSYRSPTIIPMREDLGGQPPVLAVRGQGGSGEGQSSHYRGGSGRWHRLRCRRPRPRRTGSCRGITSYVLAC
jgi:hypothetical protein